MRCRKTVADESGIGFQRQTWTTGTDHGTLTLTLKLEVLDSGPPMKNPGCFNNRGSLLPPLKKYPINNQCARQKRLRR
jgi:hypothetical protein